MPLYYVICPEPNLIPVFDINEDGEIIYHASHNDFNFQVDNMYVHHIIDKLETVTDANDWINILLLNSNVWAVYNYMCEHYEGPYEGN